MMVEVVAHPGSSREEVVIRDGVFHVYVRTVPEKGSANEAIIKLLAQHFHVPRTKIFIKRGATSKKKLVVVDNE